MTWCLARVHRWTGWCGTWSRQQSHYSGGTSVPRLAPTHMCDICVCRGGPAGAGSGVGGLPLVPGLAARDARPAGACACPANPPLLSSLCSRRLPCFPAHHACYCTLCWYGRATPRAACLQSASRSSLSSGDYEPMLSRPLTSFCRQAIVDRMKPLGSGLVFGTTKAGAAHIQVRSPPRGDTWLCRSPTSMPSISGFVIAFRFVVACRPRPGPATGR